MKCVMVLILFRTSTFDENINFHKSVRFATFQTRNVIFGLLSRSQYEICVDKFRIFQHRTLQPNSRFIRRNWLLLFERQFDTRLFPRCDMRNIRNENVFVCCVLFCVVVFFYFSLFFFSFNFIFLLQWAIPRMCTRVCLCKWPMLTSKCLRTIFFLFVSEIWHNFLVCFFYLTSGIETQWSRIIASAVEEVQPSEEFWSISSWYRSNNSDMITSEHIDWNKQKNIPLNCASFECVFVSVYQQQRKKEF